MFRFSRPSRSYLEEAGWYPGRRVHITPYVAFLEEQGFEPSQPIREFFEEFGGLEIQKTFPNLPGSSPTMTYLDPRRADLATPASIDRCKALTGGVPLIPVGQTEPDIITLLMSSEGHVFGVWDWYMALFGYTGCEGLDRLLRGPPIRKLACQCADWGSETGT